MIKNRVSGGCLGAREMARCEKQQKQNKHTQKNTCHTSKRNTDQIPKTCTDAKWPWWLVDNSSNKWSSKQPSWQDKNLLVNTRLNQETSMSKVENNQKNGNTNLYIHAHTCTCDTYMTAPAVTYTLTHIYSYI